MSVFFDIISIGYLRARGISILGEVRNVEISRVTHDFVAIFALAIED